MSCIGMPCAIAVKLRGTPCALASNALRYTVENFLPERHERWGKELKYLQDALGEVHDLDVLWERIRAHGFEDREAVARWRTRVVEERARRIDAYRERMVGPGSLWQVWRGSYLKGRAAPGAINARTNARRLQRSQRCHARHVVRLALQVHDGLQKGGVFIEDAPSARNALELAAMLQDVGGFAPDAAITSIRIACWAAWPHRWTGPGTIGRWWQAWPGTTAERCRKRATASMGMFRLASGNDFYSWLRCCAWPTP